MQNIGVLVSGGGTNLQAIIDKIDENYIRNAKIATVVSSKEGAYALERCRRHNIPSIVISKKDFKNVDEYDSVIIQHFEKYNVDLIVLAGFLSIFGERFVDKYRNRVINVHPSLVPSFCGIGYYGIKPHKAVIDYGVKITGATVHFVDLGVDAGPVILQKAVEVKYDDTPEILQKRVMEEAEWFILPEAIKLFTEGRLIIEGRKVKILP